MRTQVLTRSALIAALYVALTVAVPGLSYGQIQFRISEALTVLPIFFGEGVWALYVGAMIANVFGGLGLWDILGGSAITLLAALLTRATRRRPLLAVLPPVVLNGFLVPLYLAPILGVPYWPTVAYVSLGEAAVIGLLGLPLLWALQRNQAVRALQGDPGRQQERVRP